MTHEQKAMEIASNPSILINGFPTDTSAIDVDALSQLILTALHEASSARDEIWKQRLVSAITEARRQALEEAARVAERMHSDFCGGDRLTFEFADNGPCVAAAIRALAQEGET